MMLLCWNQIDAYNTNRAMAIEIHCVRWIKAENERHLFEEGLIYKIQGWAKVDFQL